MQDFKTLHSMASGKDQDNNSNTSKPSYNMVQDVKGWRSKRKANTNEGSSKKKLRYDGVTYASSPHSVILHCASVRRSKRKADTDDDSPNKKIRDSNDTNITEPGRVLFEGVNMRQSKRTAHTNTDKSSKKMRSSGHLNSSSTCSSSDEDKMYGLSFSVKNSRADFEAKYMELLKIGEGGFGAVYAGYCTEDIAPVAVKHIPKEKVHYMEVVQNGKVYMVIDEVALMVKAAGGDESPRRSAAISLIDCYDLEEELILVMERPAPSMDLHKYRRTQGGYLQEDEAKIILRQMVDAAIEMHKNGVFHRDIKLGNILIETGSSFPRIRVIDFGCGCLVREGYYHCYSGTLAKAPPEWFMVREYQASPTTVWQLGTLLYDLLDHEYSFNTIIYFDQGFEINSDLTRGCQEFLQMCLVTDPERRASLEQLQLHPWLK